MDNITFISAGAGSGKTYNLMERLAALLLDENSGIKPEGVMATTFTVRASNELKERVQEKLLHEQRPELAAQMESAFIGTVNGVCGRLLKQFSFELGLSPQLDVIPENETSALFRRALDQTLNIERVQGINRLANRFSVEDWRKDVEGLVQAARANNLTAEQLRSQGAANANKQLSFCGQPKANINALSLLKLLNKSVGEIDTSIDSTKATAGFIDQARGMNMQLSGDNWAWVDWLRLAKAGVGAKSRACVEELIDYASRFEVSLEYQNDVRNYLEQLFAVAADAMADFQAMKTRMGLIDFVDQERELLRALELPHVCAVLEDELDLLMVDEFQDTSPIQLALFLKLSQLATQVIWVGDIKQSIYGFRGSDPSLMLGVIEAMTQRGMAIDTLEHSWRSRPELIELVNSIFVTAFAGELEPQQVALQFPEQRWGVKWPTPALQIWAQNSRNASKRQSVETQANDIAYGVRQLVDSGISVIDKGTQQPRPMALADIGILCRTGKNIARVSKALEQQGLAVNLKREALMATPEAVLIKAALRLLVNPRATLARAELISLVANQPVAEWLNQRVSAVKSEAYAEDKMAGLNHEVIERMLAMRDALRFTTPVETLRRLLWQMGARDIVMGWGGHSTLVQQRLLNLDEMVVLASNYEQHCQQQNAATTVAGLLLWLDTLASDELDKQAQVEGADAITVVTHHGAKGLEWPVVLCCDYGDALKGDLWGIKAITTEPFDVNAPLANRFLHYWVPPSAWHKTNMAFYDKAEASEYGLALLEASRRESQRLVYVSMTRARDMLILPCKASVLEKGTGLPWLTNVGADWILEATDTLELGDDAEIPTQVMHLDAGEPISQHSQQQYFGFTAREPQAYPIANISPSQAKAIAIKVASNQQYAGIIPLPTDRDAAIAGTALHAVLATQLLQQQASEADIIKVGQQLLNSAGLSALDTQAVIKAGTAFLNWLTQQWPGAKLYMEYPVSMTNAVGQLLNGTIDLLIETDQGWVIIDHKSTSTELNDLPHVASHYGGQLAAYRHALQAVTNKPVLSQWLHFMAMGSVLECELVE
ncbi:UvrD-helicase domain-containing protein [Dasania marina]|uniref:UvrD-helicase domain-containing protein n=1 Tax=Dasania marina TaxID=471499 RepID=UPI00036429D8|nr:UvrD-helicase domain-containing protein [Dasania marina]